MIIVTHLWLQFDSILPKTWFRIGNLQYTVNCFAISGVVEFQYLSVITMIDLQMLFIADSSEEVSPQSSSSKNIWKERLEFYHSAQPRTEEEEDLMMKRALEESQKLEEERQRQILAETTTCIRLLYASVLNLKLYRLFTGPSRLWIRFKKEIYVYSIPRTTFFATCLGWLDVVCFSHWVEF